MSSFETLFELIGDLARKRYQEAEKNFAPIGLNHSEARLLSLLQKSGGRSTQEILSSQLSIDRSNAGRALNKLEKNGYVTREESLKDRRTRLVLMTKLGMETVVEIQKIRKQIIEDLFSGLSEAEAHEAALILQKVQKK